MKVKTIIVGAFHEIIELIEESDIQILGLIDNNRTGKYRSYPVLCNDANASKLTPEYKHIPLVITPDLPLARLTLCNLYSKLGFKFLSLISKSAKISKSSKIGIGTIVQYGVNVSSEVTIGKFVKLNVSSNIMHNSIIGDYSTVAPNAVVLGNVRIGGLCYIGSNSTILPNLTICDNVIVGAGAVVTKDILFPGTYVGIPASLK